MGQNEYLVDSYRTKFQSVVTETELTGKGVKIRLKDNYFYPDCGGQPADRGRIGSATVLDVQLLEEDVIISLDKEPDSDYAEIDWVRRYDHMQQHTGQHLLSAAIIQLFDASTLAFHLGEQVATIDISLPGLNPAKIEKIEQLCAEYIAQALPVTAFTVTASEFQELSLRKKALPDHIRGDIRLIKIGEVDTAHCGGTHLHNTSEIQLLKIIATEKIKENLRIHFLAGSRAIKDYQKKHSYLGHISDSLTCSIWDIDQIIEKTRNENKELSSQNKKLTRELASFKAGQELENAKTAGEFAVITKVYQDFNPGDLKSLASEMTARMENLLFCGISRFNGKAAVVLAAGKKFQGDLGPACKKIMSLLQGKGGGRGNFAQGSGEIGNIDDAIVKSEILLIELGKQQ